MKPIFRSAAIAGLCVVALAGCQTKAEKSACPVVSVLATTASLTEFQPGSSNDPSSEIYNLQMTGADQSCSFDLSEGTAESDVTITFVARRPPSGDGATYTVPYYIASVVDGATILHKQNMTTSFSFAPGAASTTFSVDVRDFMTRYTNGTKPYQYGLVVGLQLTIEQVTYNKTLRNL